MNRESDSLGPSRGRWRPSARIWLLPAALTVAWVVFVLAFELTPRVLDHWATVLTMTVGSFVAGSTPQGGGAVAFPVFTKALHIPAAVARSFSLIIQSTGMVVAAATIAMARREVHGKAVVVSCVGSTAGFAAAVFGLGDFATPFCAPIIPAPYIKVGFSIAVAMVALVVILSRRRPCESHHQGWTSRSAWAVAAFAFAGGVASALLGSGADVFLFMVLVLVLGVPPRIAVPTSVIAMAWTSLLGLAVFGFWDGQLDVSIVDGLVVSVGDHPLVVPRRLVEADLPGMWLAAAPVVIWGAPLGAWFASIMAEKSLAAFVVAMAALEVVTTILFLAPLRSDPSLALFGVLGLGTAIAAVFALARYGPPLIRPPAGCPAGEI